MKQRWIWNAARASSLRGNFCARVQLLGIPPASQPAANVVLVLVVVLDALILALLRALRADTVKKHARQTDRSIYVMTPHRNARSYGLIPGFAGGHHVG